jgi:hypothetical protein
MVPLFFLLAWEGNSLLLLCQHWSFSQLHVWPATLYMHTSKMALILCCASCSTTKSIHSSPRFLLRCTKIMTYLMNTYFYWLRFWSLPLQHCMIILHIKLLPSHETAVDIVCFCSIKPVEVT